MLAEVIESGKTLKELAQRMILVPKVNRNVYLRNHSSPIKEFELSAWPKTSDAVQAAREELGTHGRILLRASGTEPAIRIQVEGYDGDRISQIAENISDVVNEESAQAA